MPPSEPLPVPGWLVWRPPPLFYRWWCTVNKQLIRSQSQVLQLIDWNCFSGEWCGPWASIMNTLHWNKAIGHTARYTSCIKLNLILKFTLITSVFYKNWYEINSNFKCYNTTPSPSSFLRYKIKICIFLLMSSFYKNFTHNALPSVSKSL